MSKFQVIFIAILIFIIFAGVAIFATFKDSSVGAATVKIWGTLPQIVFDDFLNQVRSEVDQSLKIVYEEKSESDFDKEFIEALARREGPDVILIPHDKLLRHIDKIYEVSYKAYSERIFKDAFIEEGELYLRQEGVVAFPFSIDPLVMYWNRDIFSDVTEVSPPERWGAYYDLIKKINTEDDAHNITKTALSLGEFENVNNAKEILALLFMQSGNPIVDRLQVSTPTQSTNTEFGLRSTLQERYGLVVGPSEIALNFYAQFSNPIKTFYSWNRTLPASKSFFLSGDLATYFGFASEYADLKKKNSNLNFDVAFMPQSDQVGKRMTFGRMMGFSLLTSSAQIAEAYRVVNVLTSDPALELWVSASGLPPVRRSLLAKKPESSAASVFYDSALNARSWFDPDALETKNIFQDLVESVTSGRSRISDAVQKATQEIDLLFERL